MSWIPEETKFNCDIKLQTCLINSYLEKVLYIIEKGTKQLILLPSDVRLMVNLNNQLDTNYVMAKNKAIFAVSKTIKQLHILKDMHMIYKQDFYKETQNEIDDLFLGFLVLVMDDLEHPVLIE